MGDERQGPEARIRGVSDALGHCLDWKWDARFGTALAEFPASERDRVLQELSTFLNVRWEPGRLQGAPDIVGGIVAKMGGLMPGQMLLTSDVEEWGLLFCAWWPWGNGRTISIRLAPYGPEAPEDRVSELAALLRDGLGI